MTAFWYLLPIETVGRYRGPRYLKWRFGSGDAGRWSMKDFGPDCPLALVATEMKLPQWPDVFTFPDTLTGDVGQTTLDRLTGHLRDAGIETGWLKGADSHRLSLHKVTGLTQAMQSGRDEAGDWLTKPVYFGFVGLEAVQPGQVIVSSRPNYKFPIVVVDGVRCWRFPDDTLLPVIGGGALPASEDFTGTTGNQVSSLANWANVAGDGFDIQTNEAQTDTPNNEAADRWSSDAFNDDQYAEATLTADANTCYGGVAVRCASGAETYYGFYSSSDDSCYLFKMVASSWSQLGSSGSPYSTSSVIRLEVEGTTITPKVDGVIEDPPGAQTDSSIASGSTGICGYGDGATRVDDWGGGNVGVTDLSASVSDAIAVADSPTVSVSAPSFYGVSVSDTVAIAENVILAGVPNPSVSDAIAIAESVNISLPEPGALSVSVSDAIAIAESTSADVSDPQASASDAIAIGESVNASIGEAPDLSISVSDSVAIAEAVGIVPAGEVYETFEDTADQWRVSQDTSGTGSTVTRSDSQAYAGTYSAACFTTNSSAVAQVRDTISVGSTGETWRWYRARIYLPSATTAALTGSEYLTLAGIWPTTGDPAGWYVRVGENDAVSLYGYTNGGWHDLDIYYDFPTDEWVELEIGLHTENNIGYARAFAILIDGDFIGWINQGDLGSAAFNRAAFGILGTNSTDDLTVYVDDFCLEWHSQFPRGTDNRTSDDPQEHDFTDQSGVNIGVDYSTWESQYTLDATHGMYCSPRFQAGHNHERLGAIEEGWAEVEISWPNGTPSDTTPNQFFGPMVGFRKDVGDEENLEIVPYGDGAGNVNLRFEAWPTQQGTVFDTWALPLASIGGGSHIPEDGDKYFVEFEEVSGTNLRVSVHYYDASAGGWTLNVINDNWDVSDENGVDFMDADHATTTITSDSGDYSFVYINFGTLDTTPRWIQVSDSITIGESVSVSISTDLEASASDAIGVSESVAVSLPDALAVSVADAFAIGETVTVQVAEAGAFSISVSDAVAISEQASIQLTDLAVITADAIAAAESVTVSMQAVATLAVNVSDTIALAEQVTLQLEIAVTASDAIALAESVNISLVEAGALAISVSDAIAIAEQATISLADDLAVTASDSIAIAESVTVSVIAVGTLSVSVSDSLAIAETVTLQVTIEVAVADSISVAENVSISVLAAGTLGISVSEPITVVEAVSGALDALGVVSTDALAISEAIAVSVGSPGVFQLSVSDSVAIADQTTIQALAILAIVSDALNVSESVVLSGIATSSVGGVVRSAQEMVPNLRSGQHLTPTIAGGEEL